MDKNDFAFFEPLTEDELGKLTGGFAVYAAETSVESDASVSVTVKTNSTCRCKCTIKGDLPQS